MKYTKINSCMYRYNKLKLFDSNTQKKKLIWIKMEISCNEVVVSSITTKIFCYTRVVLSLVAKCINDANFIIFVRLVVFNKMRNFVKLGQV